MITNSSSQYVQTVNFTNTLPDEESWERLLLEMGLEREAFSITASDRASATLKFWEPDRIEALRFLAKLDGVQ